MLLTIFTPTYNRASTLKRLYNSLLKQTNKHFEWIIVDDGSTDETANLVSSFDTKDFVIKYRYQENQGKHVATNIGMDMAKGDLFTCLDSDDWFYEDAVEYIINYFSIRKDTQALIGLDTDEHGNIIGKEFNDLRKVRWIDMRYLDKNVADKCYVFQTNLVKKVIFPQCGNSKHMPPSYQMVILNDQILFDTTNKKLKFVEYRNDGITHSIKKQMYISSENYCIYRKVIHSKLPNTKEKIKNIILFNISWLETKLNIKYSFTQPIELLFSLMLLPLSFIFYHYYKRISL